jgi:hypothetical protein
MQMHPTMIQAVAELKLSEARACAARQQLARAARAARQAGTIRPQRGLHRWRSTSLLPALRSLRAI